jgi:RHS repeat-associated protein
LGGFQYESITTSQTLQFVPTPEGYYSFQNNQYIYQYKDHLGNVRVSFFSDNGSPSIIEENNYYPIGMAHNNTHISNTYTYQYNGKELQLENGMYDYGARMYMPDIGRWGTVDPLAELYSSYSPYHMVAGNPIMYIDHDGRSYESAIGSPMNDIRAKHPNVYSGWEYIDGVKMGDWNRLPQFNSMIDYLSSSGSAGGGYEVRWKPGGGFTYFSHWTGGGYLPNGYDAGTGHWKTVRPWDLWNSDMARWLVPDRLGATLSVSAGGGVEAGATGGFEIITRGRHAGVYFDPFNTISLGGLIGGSADIDYNLFTSHFSGSVSKLTLDSVVGTEAYIKGGITPGIGINGGYSVSFDPGNPFGGDYPRWHTTTGGVSLGASTPYLGAGLTYSNTRIGIGFDGKFRFASFVTIPKY